MAPGSEPVFNWRTAWKVAKFWAVVGLMPPLLTPFQSMIRYSGRPLPSMSMKRPRTWALAPFRPFQSSQSGAIVAWVGARAEFILAFWALFGDGDAPRVRKPFLLTTRLLKLVP